MIVPMVVTIITKFGKHMKKTSGSKSRIICQHYFNLLTFILYYGTVFICKCHGSTLFHSNVISDNQSSLISFSEKSEHHSTLSPHMNLFTVAAAVVSNGGSDSIHIIRNNLGDTFFDDDQSWSSCSVDRCTSRSSGTATIALESNINNDGKKLLLNRYSNLCYCRCLQTIPAFREDMHVCVDDIHECSLVSFVSGSIEQKIPYVFLPLRGQIVYPNAEINFNGLKSTPICIVSRVRYLSRSGWYDIKNYSISGNDPTNSLPFKLFHDEQRTFLQWLGSADLRISLEGRLLLIDLICKERDSQSIFTPCISFRVAGIPSTKTISIDDVFDRNASKGAKFSFNEYVALGLATLLLALIYIASVFLYLHLKKNKLKEKSSRRGNTFRKYINIEDNASHLFGENQSKKLIVEEEGLIKNNPLLMKRYYPSTMADSTPVSSIDGNRLSEENTFFSLMSNNDHNNSIIDKSDDNVQTKLVSAVVHPRGNNVVPPTVKRFENSEQQRWQVFSNRSLNPFSQPFFQKEEDNNNLFFRKKLFERQQQLDINNIEEKHPDENISIVECPEDVIHTNSRHKLYFNPAYFEPELLMAPPPAAVEFLSKIREVMTIAKRKMSMKKFLPSLTQIPEELQSTDESKCSFNSGKTYHRKELQQNDSNIPGNNFSSENTDYRSNDDKEKHQIIQKWLQGISIVSEQGNNQFLKGKISHQNVQYSVVQSNANKKQIVNNNLMSMKSSISENNGSENNSNIPPLLPKRDTLNVNKPVLPLRKKFINLNNTYLPECNHSIKPRSENDKSKSIALCDDYDGRSQPNLNPLMSNNNNFSSGLPLDEELTMHNAIYNVVTGSTTLSKLKARYETNENKMDSITENLDGKYSLVSEVYVNDGFSSSNSSLISINSSEETEKPSKKVSRLVNKEDESSRLMIQLNDCPFFYSIENVDDFEPDTLDRKPIKENEDNLFGNQMNFVDSLERPAISLRTYGSFRQDSCQPFGTNKNGNLKRTFGSLQEIYESRRKIETENNRFADRITVDDSPQSLTSQMESVLWRKEKQIPRHRYRQRKQSPPPPLPQTGNSLPYLPSKLTKPPLPPRKNEVTFQSDRKNSIANGIKAQSCNELHSSSFRNNFISENKLNVCFNNNVWSSRPDDSGYLSSSDSDKSKHFSEQKHQMNVKHNNDVNNHNEDDEDDDDDDDDDSISCCNDGNSESGAESIETNFKFYKNRGKTGRESCNIDGIERQVPIADNI